MVLFKKLRRSVHEIIRDDDENTWIGNLFDGIIISLIIISLIQVILDTFNLSPLWSAISGIVEMITIVVFTIEYLLRLWTAPLLYPQLPPWKARLKYMLSFMALIDLVSILPFYLPYVIPIDLRVLRSLRMIRLLRLFKVNRYTDALSSIASVFKAKASQLISSLLVVSLLMVMAAVLMYNVENAAQPEAFSNALDALWWAVATFTTVGYGDVYPITGAGKLLSAIIAILGIGLVAVPTGIISAGFTEQIEHTKRQAQEEMRFCPFCGHSLDKS